MPDRQAPLVITGICAHLWEIGFAVWLGVLAILLSTGSLYFPVLSALWAFLED